MADKQREEMKAEKPSQCSLTIDLLDEAERLAKKKHEPAEEDQALTRIKRYFGDGHYVYGTAAAQIRAICDNPTVVPQMSQWSRSFHDKLPAMVTGVLMQPGYLDDIWPQVKLVMGTSVGNVTWAAQVATSIAFFDLLKFLAHPTAREDKLPPPAGVTA